MSSNLAGLQDRLGYRFRDPHLLKQALTHRSFAREAGGDEHNERLELLGDAVLGLLATEILMTRFADHSEGRLTKIKAGLVNSEALLREAESLGIGDCLRLGKAEERSGGRSKKTLLADAVEAVIAAVYLDGGLDSARSVVKRLGLREERLAETDRTLGEENPKSTLQELLQSRGLALPAYSVVSEDGPPHQRRYRIRIEVNGLFRAEASAATKKAAEQKVAAEALRDTSWLPPAQDERGKAAAEAQRS